MSTQEMEDVPMKLKLPLHHRVYFFVRLQVVRFFHGAIWICTKIRWPWAVFHLMTAQKRLAFRFHR